MVTGFNPIFVTVITDGEFFLAPYLLKSAVLITLPLESFSLSFCLLCLCLNLFLIVLRPNKTMVVLRISDIQLQRSCAILFSLTEKVWNIISEKYLFLTFALQSILQ